MRLARTNLCSWLFLQPRDRTFREVAGNLLMDDQGVGQKIRFWSGCERRVAVAGDATESQFCAQNGNGGLAQSLVAVGEARGAGQLGRKGEFRHRPCEFAGRRVRRPRWVG